LARREVPCEGHVLALAVDQAWRGEGIGSALLSRVRSELRRDGAMHLCLEVRASNRSAVAFYQRHGFHPEGLQEHAYADGEDAVRFGRPI